MLRLDPFGKAELSVATTSSNNARDRSANAGTWAAVIKEATSLTARPKHPLTRLKDATALITLTSHPVNPYHAQAGAYPCAAHFRLPSRWSFWPARLRCRGPEARFPLHSGRRFQRDLRVEGSTFYETPNIDGIARTGMRFTQGYANCRVCSPSRANIMLGKCPATTWDHRLDRRVGGRHRLEAEHQAAPARYNRNLPHGDTTLAETLRPPAAVLCRQVAPWQPRGSWPAGHGFEINVGGWDVGGPEEDTSPRPRANLNDGPDGESLPIPARPGDRRFVEEHRASPSWPISRSTRSMHRSRPAGKKWSKYQQ